MKTPLTILSLFVVGTLWAQPGTNEQTLQKQTPARLPNVVVQSTKPNEIKGSKYTYSGIAVQSVKTDNPWQLVNPFAPARYGSGEDNLHRDPITKQESGLKIFSLGF